MKTYQITLLCAASLVSGYLFGSAIQQKKMQQDVDEAKQYFLDQIGEALQDAKDELEKEKAAAENVDEQTKLLKDAVDEVEALQNEQEEVADSLVESAAELIKRVGYNQMSEKKPAAEAVEPKGPTVSSTPAISELPVVIDLYEYDQTDDPRYKDWEQYTLTYYVGDNTLVSQADSVIEGKDRVRTVGDLLGSFPDDGDSLYIRSPILKMDFEVVRDPRKYADVRGD
jgi:hypothetical protein